MLYIWCHCFYFRYHVSKKYIKNKINNDNDGNDDDIDKKMKENKIQSIIPIDNNGKDDYDNNDGKDDNDNNNDD